MTRRYLAALGATRLAYTLARRLAAALTRAGA